MFNQRCGESVSRSEQSAPHPEHGDQSRPAQTTRATIAYTHYFDIERDCCDCGRRFIFFAEEQKYWYEELGFYGSAVAVRCVPCRKQRQQSERLEKAYARQRADDAQRDAAEAFEIADAALTLIEEKRLPPSQKVLDRVRMLLNRIPEDSVIRNSPTFAVLIERLGAAARREY